MSTQFLVATRKGLFTVERSGAGNKPWTIAHSDFLGDNVSIAIADPRDGRLYAALDHGHFGVKLHRAKGIGEPWEEIAAPVYPEKPEGEDSADRWGKPIAWNLVRIWALEPGGNDQPGVIWCGTIPGGLFRSSDGGTSWAMIRSLWDDPKRKAWFGGGADLPGIHSICVDPRDSAHVQIAVSCGGVWATKDGGETWSNDNKGLWAAFMPPDKKDDPNIQDPHCMVRCPADPDRLWIQHHNGIFHSTDGGKMWQEIKDVQPSVFGFPVAVHPKDADTAWFVPAINDEKRIPVAGQVIVTRTRDGGKSFETLREGLPQAHAYDLVYRHALDVDQAGTRLAFGSTTGSLWVSDDQGNSWQTVAEHLPPVHAVRFVRD